MTSTDERLAVAIRAGCDAALGAAECSYPRCKCAEKKHFVPHAIVVGVTAAVAALDRHDIRAAMECALSAAPSAAAPGPSAEQERTPPPFPSIAGVQFYAVNGKGEWHYVNHAGTWQGMPAPTWAQPSAPPPDLRAKLVEAAHAAARYEPNGWSANAWKALAAWVEAQS